MSQTLDPVTQAHIKQGRRGAGGRVRRHLLRGDDRALHARVARPLRRRLDQRLRARAGASLRARAAQGARPGRRDDREGAARGAVRLRPQRRSQPDGRRAASSSAPRAAIHVRSAGSAPGDEINPAVVEAMAEVGVDMSEEFPKPLTDEVVRAADVVITMGCGDACPIYPGKRYEDWLLDDPAGQDLDTVRAHPRRDRRARAAARRRAPCLDRSLAPPCARRGHRPPSRSCSPAAARSCVDAERGGSLGPLGDRARLRARDHGHGLRHRPPLRRAHQPGRHPRLHRRPALPRRDAAAYVPAQLAGAVAAARSPCGSLWDGTPADLGATVPTVGLRRRARLRGPAHRLPDVRDHGRRDRHPRGRRGRRDRHRRHGRARRALRRRRDRRLDEPRPLLRPRPRCATSGPTSGSTSPPRSWALSQEPSSTKRSAETLHRCQRRPTRGGTPVNERTCCDDCCDNETTAVRRNSAARLVEDRPAVGPPSPPRPQTRASSLPARRPVVASRL